MKKVFLAAVLLVILGALLYLNCLAQTGKYYVSTQVVLFDMASGKTNPLNGAKVEWFDFSANNSGEFVYSLNQTGFTSRDGTGIDGMISGFVFDNQPEWRRSRHVMAEIEIPLVGGGVYKTRYPLVRDDWPYTQKVWVYNMKPGPDGKWYYAESAEDLAKLGKQ